MDANRDNWVDIAWRMRGDLKPIFARVSAEALTRFLHAASAGVLQAAQNKLAGKGWHKFGDAIQASLNRRVEGATAEVGASHEAAAMREFGGTIRAPGQGARAKRAAWLTIPVPGSPAKGKSAGDLRQAGWRFFRVAGTRGPVLMGYKPGAVLKSGKRSTRGKYAQARPMFALRKEVPHPPGHWFPTFGEIGAEIDKAARSL